MTIDHDQGAEELDAVRRVGVDLVNRLFVLIKTTQLFEANNRAVEVPATRFLEALSALGALQEATASLGIVDDNLLLNRHLLKPDPATYLNGRSLARLYRRLKAQELEFDCALTRADLGAFMAALRRVLVGQEPSTLLDGLTGFRLVPVSEQAVEDDAVDLDPRVQVLRVFAASIAVMDRVMAIAARGQRWSPSLVRRVAHDLVDAARREPDLLLGLLLLPVQGSMLGAHLVRAAVLSTLVLQRTGLPRRNRVEVALVALYHHLGSPAGDSLAEDEPARGAAEPLAAAVRLGSGGGLNRSLIECVVGVYEAAGAAVRQRRLYLAAPSENLLGRVVFIADRYAELLEGLRPDEALRALLVEEQEREPVLTRLLVNAVGLYPVGTVVDLESGARAVVVEAPRRRGQLLRPTVQIIEGGEPALIDLSQDRGHGRITGTVNTAESGLNVSHYFLL